MKTVIAVLSLIVSAAGSSSRGDELARLAQCSKPHLVSTTDWIKRDQGWDFSLQLPSCFERDPEPPVWEHGYQRWRCGSQRVDVVWGHWNTIAFSGLEQCKASVAGMPIVVARRNRNDGGSALGKALGGSVLVWYLTGMLHEPIVSVFGEGTTDKATLDTIALSGTQFVRRDPNR
jgi:hypothetical protein